MSQDKFRAFWIRKASLDAAAKADGRPAAPLTDVFPLLESALDGVASESRGLQEVIARGLEREQRNFLLNAARGMAVLAVRERRGERLRYGLQSLLIEGAQLDAQETISYLSLLNHSASKLGIDLGHVFEPLTSTAPRSACDIVEKFLEKPDTAKAIDLFGFVEVNRASGFDYKRAL